MPLTLILPVNPQLLKKKCENINKLGQKFTVKWPRKMISSQQRVGQSTVGQKTVGHNTVGQQTFSQRTVGQHTLGQSKVPTDKRSNDKAQCIKLHLVYKPLESQR